MPHIRLLCYRLYFQFFLKNAAGPPLAAAGAPLPCGSAADVGFFFQFMLVSFLLKAVRPAACILGLCSPFFPGKQGFYCSVSHFRTLHKRSNFVPAGFRQFFIKLSHSAPCGLSSVQTQKVPCPLQKQGHGTLKVHDTGLHVSTPGRMCCADPFR